MAAPNTQRVELQVGAFLFFGLILLGVLILKFGDFRYWFRSKYRIDAQFTDAGTLVKGAPVRRGGVEIGRVEKDPFLNEGNAGVRVPLEIYTEFHVAEGSVFKIATDGIIGDSFIQIEAGPSLTGKMIEEGALVMGAEGGLARLEDTATQIADKTLVVMEDIRTSLKDMGDAIKRIQTGVLSDANLSNLEHSLSNLNETIEKLDKGVLSDENVASVGATLKKVETSADKLGVAVDQVSTTFTNVDKAVTTKLNPSLEEFQKAAVSIRKAAESLGLVATDMHSAPGLVQALLRDETLRNDFVRFAANLRKYGIWRYKDSAPDPAAPTAPAQTSPPPPEKKSRLPWSKKG